MKKKETVLSVVKEIRDLLLHPAASIPAIQSKDGRFIRNPDGTVTDKQFNLIWYPTLDKKMTWQEAQEECKKIGCRLPTRKELESLIDITKYNPAVDKEIFPDTKTDDWYWTSDVVAGGPGHAWYVGFYYGYVNSWGKDYNNYVRPVRSSQN